MTQATLAKPATPAAPDLAAIKTRQQAAWSSGDYAVVGTTLQIVGEDLCEALDLRAGQSVLDVAAGNGNVSLAAARRWCAVTSTDYVPALLDRGRLRAAADGLEIAFREADAEALPFPDQSFDAVVSTFGVMFTPNQDRAAAEMVRVCRPGGKIGMANWTPDGFIGQLFKTIGKHLAPPAGVRSPALWGTPRGSPRCSSPMRPRSDRHRAASCSAIARPTTGWRSSGPGTARCSRPSRRWSPPHRPRSRPTSGRSSPGSTGRATRPWSCRASTSRS
jgi:SAM-dependent methyltransferase